MSAKFTCVHSDHEFNENSSLDWELQCEDNILTILSNPLLELCIIFWMYMNWQLASYWSGQTQAKPANQHLKSESLEYETHWSWKRVRNISHWWKNWTQKSYPKKLLCIRLGKLLLHLIHHHLIWHTWSWTRWWRRRKRIHLSLPSSEILLPVQQTAADKRGLGSQENLHRRNWGSQNLVLLKRTHPNLPSQTKRCNKHFKRMQSVKESNREG